MPTSLQDQFATAWSGVTTADIDLLAKVLSEPDAITIEEQRTVAEKLGIKNRMAKFFVNTVTDPVVWLSALMSRRFPTTAYLNDIIPDRFIGAQNDFSGVSLLGRTVSGFFRGTGINRLTALKQYKEMKVLESANGLFKDILEYGPDWQQDMPIISLLREGINPAGATPKMKAMADRIGGAMEEAWGFLSQTQKVRGGFVDNSVITKAYARPFKSHEAPKYLRNYLPHIPQFVGGKDSVIIMEGQEALRKMKRGSLGQYYQMRGMSPEQVWSPTATERLASDFTRYQGMLGSIPSQVFNRHLFVRHRNLPINARVAGQELFITDLNVVLPKYFHSVARTYANNSPLSAADRVLASWVDERGVRQYPDADPIVMQIINRGLNATGAKFSQRKIRGTDKIVEQVVPGTPNAPTMLSLQSLVRQVQGSASEDEIIWGNLFNGVMDKFTNAARRVAGKPELDQTARAMNAFMRNSDYRNISNGIAGWFYASTLGLNPWSAIQNVFQTGITTMPTIGIGPTIAGIKTLGERLPMYAKAVRAEWDGMKRFEGVNTMRRLNIATESAFAKTFPELARGGIRIDPRMFDVDEEALVLAGKGGAFKNVDAFNKFLLQPFQHTEMANQIVAFYGGKQALKNHMRTGAMPIPTDQMGRALTGQALDESLNFNAAMIVNETQFRPGPGSRSLFQQSLPAPLRMFTSFPLRLANYFADSTVRGAMTSEQMKSANLLERLTGGRNLGGIARSLMFSRLAQFGARDVLGVDLGGSLGLLSAIKSSPIGDDHFAIPFPPAARIVTGLASYASTRDVRELQPMILPGIGEIPLPRTLVPGGVAISRAVRAYQQFRPDMGGMVDDNERLMYRSDAVDLGLSMLGVPLDKGRRTRNALERITGNKLVISDLKRKYAQSWVNGDFDTMTAAAQRHGELFPDLPPLSISDSDLQRYRTNASITSVQRMARSLGKAGSMLESQLYEYDPELVAGQGF